MKDADNPPLAIRDTWSALQSVLHSAISKQQLTAAVTCSSGRPLPYLVQPVTQFLVMLSVSTVLTGTPAAVSVSSLPQSSHVALLRRHLFRRR